ncbi:hypothetical protein H0X48_00495 [Candidatus Dependentiae bacterium]|nr:hypothetical protein [Candidatus Dependentiae bacterium]
MYYFKNFLVLSSILLLSIYVFKFSYNTHTAFSIQQATCFIPQVSTRRLGIIGCTPHPTYYLKKNGYILSSFNKLALNDFLDREYLADSYRELFVLCKKHCIDELLIAYLPIYFADLGLTFKDNTSMVVERFFKIIMPELRVIIEQSLQLSGYTGKVSLVLPTSDKFAQLPLRQTVDISMRIRYLVKHMPRIRFSPNLQEIVIINNKQSTETNENAELINLLLYEYVLERPLNYTTLSLSKTIFHSYV